MSQLFIAHTTPGGYTSTITTRLGHALTLAEQRYGVRDKEYTILGIEFNQDLHPRIWYPGNCKHIAIQLTLNCIDNMSRAIYQMSHEVIHCLSPSGGRNANVLEEGLATLFSIEYSNLCGYLGWTSGNRNYENAALLTQELLNLQADIILEARKVQPMISRLTSDIFLQINPNIHIELLNQLLAPFTDV